MENQRIEILVSNKQKLYTIDELSLSTIKEAKGHYTYLFLDPRKSCYRYLESVDLFIEYECFYVGKGKFNRAITHFSKNQTLYRKVSKYNKIRKIINSGYLPIVKIINNNLSEQEANTTEINLIKEIGREDKRKGTLVNLTNGGAGCPGKIESLKAKEKRVSAYVATLAKLETHWCSEEVYQYDFSGHFIKKWSSMNDVINSIPKTSGIRHIFSKGKKEGKCNSAGGFMWFREYMGAKTNPMIFPSGKTPTKVYQYRIIDDLLIEIHEGAKQASIKTGITEKAIRYSVANSHKKTGKEFYWRRF